MKKNGFTLAEVLITLVIIGVIGALTVPALIQNTQKQEYVSALKKTYSTLSQAVQIIIAEEGSPKGDAGWASSAANISKLFKQHISSIKTCKENGKCFAPNTKYKTLNGSSAGDHFLTIDNIYAGNERFMTADGTAVFVDPYWSKTACSGTWSGSAGLCSLIYVDINGHKAPNTAGRDLFFFALKEDGLYPIGCDDAGNHCANTEGFGCACNIITENAMNY